jgi:hypothetical protein
MDKTSKLSRKYCSKTIVMSMAKLRDMIGRDRELSAVSSRTNCTFSVCSAQFLGAEGDKHLQIDTNLEM